VVSGGGAATTSVKMMRKDPPLETAADTQILTQLQVGAAVEPGGLFSPYPTAVSHGTAMAVLVDQPPWGDEHSGCEAQVDLLKDVIQPIGHKATPVRELTPGRRTRLWVSQPKITGPLAPASRVITPTLGNPRSYPPYWMSKAASPSTYH
jgi:hypothetical protein